MSLGTRIGRMEAASPAQAFRIDAVDEADYNRQFQKILFGGIKHAPCVLDLEVHMNGEVTYRRMSIPIFEDILELLD